MGIGKELSLRDIKFAVRRLASRPLTTVLAILALALGIGVNVACFTSINAMILRALPYPHLQRIVTLWESVPKIGEERDSVAPANFLDWKARNHSLEYLAAYRPAHLSLGESGGSEPVQACYVTSDFFSVLGMKPVAGRVFGAEYEQPGKDHIAVVSSGFWHSHLSSASNPVGLTILLEGQTYTIMGVMPESFDYPLATDLWLPLAMTGEEKTQRAEHTLQVLGLTHSGGTPKQVESELSVIASQLQQQYPTTNESRGVRVVGLGELPNRLASRFVFVLLGSATFVLLLACANVANMLLAGVSGEQKQMIVRLALGARRLQIVRPVFVESLLLSLMGAIGGLLLADWSLRFTKASIPAEAFRWIAGLKNMHLDATVVFYTLMLSILVGVICVLPSAFQVLRLCQSSRLSEDLQDRGPGSATNPAKNQLRAAIVVGEVAFALVLLVGAGLMVQAFRKMATIDAGYNVKNVLRIEVAPTDPKFVGSAEIVNLYRRSLDDLSGLPGVSAVSVTADNGTAEGLYIEHRPDPQPGEPRPLIKVVSSDYFKVMQIPVLKGRAFTAQDGNASTPVIIVSDSMARHYWPGADPIGRRVRLRSSQTEWLSVVGVVQDVKELSGGDAIPAVYVSYEQSPQVSMLVLLKTLSDPMHLAASARYQIASVSGDQAVHGVKTEEDVLAEQTSGVRISANQMATYALIAFVLAITGIYSLNSYMAFQRTREIGIRMALGARRTDILGLFVWKTARVSAIGLAIGLVMAYVLTRIVSSALYNVVSFDILTFASLTAALWLSALIAAYVPARSATRIDPSVALRHQ
jgi:putative ABC transport system permease protein